MKTRHRPVRTTIIFGLLGAIAYMPLVLLLSYVVFWPMAHYLTLWLFLFFYGLLLCRWAEKGPAAIIFPLLLLFFIILLNNSSSNIIIMGLLILSWIRSGICFQGSIFRALGSELLLCFGGGALVAFFAPHTTVTMAMGVWMFFLVQSVYFVLLPQGIATEEKRLADDFMLARRKADEIISGVCE